MINHLNNVNVKKMLTTAFCVVVVMINDSELTLATTENIGGKAA